MYILVVRLPDNQNPLRQLFDWDQASGKSLNTFSSLAVKNLLKTYCLGFEMSTCCCN